MLSYDKVNCVALTLARHWPDRMGCFVRRFNGLAWSDPRLTQSDPRLTQIVFDEGFRADLFVEQKVIIELKSVERLQPVHSGGVLRRPLPGWGCTSPLRRNNSGIILRRCTYPGIELENQKHWHADNI